MIKTIPVILLCLLNSSGSSNAQSLTSPDTVSIQSGNLTLKGLLWQPKADGPMPAILFCHGSSPSDAQSSIMLQNISKLGSLFASKGYIFLGLFRRGNWLSKDQGENSADLLDKTLKEKGQTERNKVELQEMETNQLQDVKSGLAFLRGRKEVDTNHIAVIGHSFGGSLALLMAQQDHNLKAVVIYATAAINWEKSPPLRDRLLTAAKNITTPVMIIYALNDFSLKPGYAIDSTMNVHEIPHVLQIYPKFGDGFDGHRLIFFGTDIWEADVFKFLDKYLKQ